MIFSQPQAEIKTIIIDNPSREIVKIGREYSQSLRLHMYGHGMDKHFSKIEGYEKDELMNLRAKYSRSNKDLFSRLGRPIDKVFTARGGSVYYNLPDAQDKKARALATDVRNGYSVRKWVELFWKAHMLDDPFGIIFLEILPQQQAIIAQQQGRSFIYPTYKSISSIYAYQTKGSALDWVVFELSKADKKNEGLDPDLQIYRVVDDAFDYLVQRKDEDIIILEEKTIPNYFGMVPAMVNSDIIDPAHENCFLSFYDEAIELAKHFLLKGSIKITHEFLHGFPKYWEYADDCPACGGSTLVGSEKCKDCKGTGKKLTLKVSDAKLLSYPQSKEDPIITPNVAGYVSPDRVFYEIATADLQMLEDLMNVTLWGIQSKVKTQGASINPGGDIKTATEVMDEVKPQADRLAVISEMAEKRHKFILDSVIRLQVAMNYPGSSVNYGRRYMIEGPDTLWKNYSDARAKGVAISALDDLLIEYYETKYSSDPVKLAIMMKLMKVEPFVHFKIGEVQAFRPGPEEFKQKLYFGEWLSLQNDGIILSTDIVALRLSLAEYAKAKSIVEEKPEPAI
jgi:hypothetical protein